MNNEKEFLKLCGIIKKLRAPGGCPWDREQTPSSIRGNLIEEAYECVEAIDEGDPNHICEELGDVFLVTVMLCYMHEEEGKFTAADALQNVCEKLVRRHPHVFGDVTVADSAEVLNNWAKIKTNVEGRKPKDSVLDEVSHALPPLERAYKLQKKAAKTGFDWQNADGVFSKIDEELGEVKDAFVKSKENTEGNNAELESELGDLLFSVVNLCRYLKIEPSIALQRTNVKFTKRFKYVEKCLKEHDGAAGIDVMEKYWQETKTKPF